MNEFLEFLSLVFLVFGLLQIILFFKLWGMTNNVVKIRTLLEKQTGLVWSVNKKEDGSTVGTYEVANEQVTKQEQN